MEVHNDKSIFVKRARNTGRAYHHRAMELITIYRLLTPAASGLEHEDAELRRVVQICDRALHSAAISGTKETSEANKHFKEAAQVLKRYSERHPDLKSLIPVHETMEDAKRKDGERIRKERFGMRSEGDRRRPTIGTKFILLCSLLDPAPLIVHQELSSNPSISEILWNFSRFKDHGRITLEQNPHFYSDLPANGSSYTSMFKLDPLRDRSRALKHNDIVYVLFDRPGRVFLTIERSQRVFGNVWMLNNVLIFKDRSGALEGQGLVVTPGIRGKLRYCELPVVLSRAQSNSGHIRPVISTQSANLTTGRPFEWAVLSCPTSPSTSIYDVQRPPESTEYLGPSPPTSERPEYFVLYTSFQSLNNDVLLCIFDCYRLQEEKRWNLRLAWCGLTHVCQRWRYLAHESIFRLDMRISCTNGSPLLDTLVHLPPMPLTIDYKDTNATISAHDEMGMFHALQLRDRVRSIILHLPPSTLRNLVVLMDGPFPILERLSLCLPAEDTNPVIPVTFLAPNLNHLTLVGVHLTREWSLLAFNHSLVTLTLTDIKDTGHSLSTHLVTHLDSCTQLEELSISFCTTAHPWVHGPLPGVVPTVMLPNLKRLTFRGVCALLEDLLAHIRAPILERLDITLFNQLTFRLPYLSGFTNATEVLKRSPIAKVIFERDAVIVVTDRQPSGRPPNFSLRVGCKQFDWQISAVTQICDTLIPTLCAEECLALELNGPRAELKSDSNDPEMWTQLLLSFGTTKKLRICRAFALELSRALQLDDSGSDPWLLPELQELAPEIEEEHADEAFASFIDARQVAGRPVRLSPSPVPDAQSIFDAQSIPDTQSIPDAQSILGVQLPDAQPVPDARSVPGAEPVPGIQSVPSQQSDHLIEARPMSLPITRHGNWLSGVISNLFIRNR